MIKQLNICIVLLISGCSLTAPDGKKQLLEDIERDRELGRQDSNPILGKTKFLKVRAYPQLSQGNIHGGHWILLNVGREQIDFDDLWKEVDDNVKSPTE